jgi:hypothetical protein
MLTKEILGATAFPQRHTLLGGVWLEGPAERSDSLYLDGEQGAEPLLNMEYSL